MNTVIPFFVLLGLHSSYSKVVLNVQGIAATVFTPMNDDQTVNYDVIPRYAQYLHENGVKIIIVGDLDGEIMNLSLPDAKKIVKEWFDCCKRLGIQIIVQVGGAPFVEVIELAKYCASLKVDAIMTLPDQVFKPRNISGLLDNLKLVADAAPYVPILYDHVPEISGLTELMADFAIAATREICNFCGFRFRDGNLREAYRTWRRLKEGQELFYADSYTIAAAAALGMKSFSTTLYNIVPKLVQQIVYSQAAGDSKTAMDKNDQLARIVEAIDSNDRWVPPMKAAMELVTGLKVGPPVLPERQISDERLECIGQDLTEIGVLECKENYEN